MRKITLAVAALTFILGPSICPAADNQPAGGQFNQGTVGNAPAAPDAANMATSPAAMTPPADWTQLNGTVQAVDAAAKTVQIQDNTGALLQVSVDKQVSIQKDGKNVKLSQIQTGDSIILAKRNPTAADQSKKAY